MAVSWFCRLCARLWVVVVPPAVVLNVPQLPRPSSVQLCARVPAGEIETALGELKEQGLAHSRKVQPTGGGHPAECWWPGLGPGPAPRPEGSSLSNDTPPPAAGNLAAPSASALAVANEGREGTNCRGLQADGNKLGREGTNCRGQDADGNMLGREGTSSTAHLDPMVEYRNAFGS
jgi:hypothetical protein